MEKLSLDDLGRLDIEDFKKAKKLPVYLILDNIRSMHNVGSAFRTADAFRLEKIWLCGITATPPHREIHKAALGATESVSWQHKESITDLLKELKGAGFTILAAEQTTGSISLDEFSLNNPNKVAVIFGNEVNGISEEVIPYLDACLEIPQFGTKHSLNVSVSVGIVVWEIFKKLKNTLINH